MIMALKVDVSHLVGLPYHLGGVDPRALGVDCRWTSRAALELIFGDLEAHEFPISADEEEVMLTRISAGETHWQKIGESAAAARKLGDVIYGQGEGGRSFVAVVVDQITPLALTANSARGVHLRKLRTLPGVEAVFRRQRR
jgi:hypothetical protein